MIKKEQIKSLSEKYLPEVISIRRHIHANPELSFEEYNTSEFVTSKLREYGIAFEDKIVKTGIVATIEGRNPTKKVIALRAELDALPIVEDNNVEYKSKNDGVMHACGHDVHAASLLGVAKILSELKEEFEGTVKLIFQPGEEKLPGGASLMIAEGVFGPGWQVPDKTKYRALSTKSAVGSRQSAKPSPPAKTQWRADNQSSQNPAIIFAQHVMPTIDVGKVGFRSGMYMASADEIYVTVKGKGGHAAMPHQTVNPVLIASQIIVSLQQITPDSDIPMVLSFGKVIADGATNVIPNEVKLEGTFRTMNEEWRAEAHEKMKKMAETIAESMGGSCEFNIVKGYPFLINDEETTKRARRYAEDYLGAENVEDMDLRMTSDDFAFFSQQIPACYYRLGIRNEAKGISSGVHTSTFDIDEKALETGMGLMAWIVLNELAG